MPRHHYYPARKIPNDWKLDVLAWGFYSESEHSTVSLLTAMLLQKLRIRRHLNLALSRLPTASKYQLFRSISALHCKASACRLPELTTTCCLFCRSPRLHGDRVYPVCVLPDLVLRVRHFSPAKYLRHLHRLSPPAKGRQI